MHFHGTGAIAVAGAGGGIDGHVLIYTGFGLNVNYKY
jgi:hypothetical protein